MENVWQTTGQLLNGPIGEGWDDWLRSILGPIAVLIFLTNISSLRLLLSLTRGHPVKLTVPRLSSVFLWPMILYGISHVVRIHAEQHAEFRAFGLALETVTAVSWVVAVAKLSSILTHLLEPSAKPTRAPVREFAAVSSSGSFSPPTNAL